LKKGSGPKPRIVDDVEVHYQGTLIDGRVFDSSIERGETITFPVRGVIYGWTEALLLMNEGSKWRLFIPADLAYREKGAGAMIGPNETLIFDVELIKVKR
jgi:FKBP-type peptidyl-prolyl cis-trans isomerase FklB